jgi:hypothetical protein
MALAIRFLLKAGNTLSGRTYFSQVRRSIFHSPTPTQSGPTRP